MKKTFFFVVCILFTSILSATADESDKDTKLIQAAKDGILSEVKALITDGASPNTTNESGVSILMLGSKNGHTDVVKFLLDKGANVNVKSTSSGTTALHNASLQGHTEIVKLLLEKGAEVNVKDARYGISSLLAASQNDNVEIVKLLLDKGADVNTKRIDGGFPLFIASQQGNTNVVNVLLEKGAETEVSRGATVIPPPSK